MHILAIAELLAGAFRASPVTPKSSRVGSSKTAVTHLTPVAEGPKSAKKRTKITVFDENSQVVQKPSFAKQLAERDAEAKRAVKISAAGQRAAATVSETILSSIPRDILFGEELEQKRAAVIALRTLRLVPHE